MGKSHDVLCIASIVFQRPAVTVKTGHPVGYSVGGEWRSQPELLFFAFDQQLLLFLFGVKKNLEQALIHKLNDGAVVLYLTLGNSGVPVVKVVLP